MFIIFDKFVRFTNPRTGKIEIGEIISSNSKAIVIKSYNHICVIPANEINKYERIKKLWK